MLSARDKGTVLCRFENKLILSHRLCFLLQLVLLQNGMCVYYNYLSGRVELFKKGDSSSNS